MKVEVLSSNAEIAHKLDFLFGEQIENELGYVFQKKGTYIIEYDSDGGVLGLVLKTTKDPFPEWQMIDTTKMSKLQCLNRIAMIHLMSFFSSPADFSNFRIMIDEEIRCCCGADTVGTTHSTWCDKHQ